jgi:hypothetical protein
MTAADVLEELAQNRRDLAERQSGDAALKASRQADACSEGATAIRGLVAFEREHEQEVAALREAIDLLRCGIAILAEREYFEPWKRAALVAPARDDMAGFIENVKRISALRESRGGAIVPAVIIPEPPK